ncbi:Pancreatic secretory granule membrane major glycoprotein GP2 [Dissostichus eleginoides]|nr:Pancreatic secretory granule membrane major glycoprotein GP2 [Dissostichus eleginoides]
MERCWATPSSDPYSNIQYTFIRESCPVLSSVQTLSVLRNGEGPDAAFRLQMFKFVGSSYTNVFLHCNVQICSLSSGQCQPNCSSVGEEELIRTRRDVPLSHTVSYGPIRRLLQDGGKPDLSGGLPAVGTLVLGGLLVLVLLLVSGLFGRLWLRSRSFYPIREAQLTLSNIHTLSEVAS